MAGVLALSAPTGAEPPNPDPDAETAGEPGPDPDLGDDPGYATTIVGTRSRAAIVRGSRAVSVVEGDALRELAPETASEALHFTPGVSVQKTNHAGGSPYVRGRTGQQVLLLVDGFRLSTSIMRAGPNQYLNTVDPAGLERLEVLRGAGSVLYGSDAIGGVISAVTRSPSRRGTEGVVQARAASVDRSSGGRGQLDTTIGEVGLLLGFGGAAIGDLRGGGPLPLAAGPVYDESVQRFTGYDQLGGDAKTTIPAGPGELTVAAMTFRQYDAPRTDKCTDTDCRFFDQQVFDLSYARWATTRLGPLRDLEAGVAVSRTLEERSRIRTNRLPELERDRVMTLQYYARASPVSRRLGEGAALQISAGTDGFLDLLASQAQTGEGAAATPALRGKYLDGSRYATAAAFGFAELVVSPALAFTAGTRLSYSRAEVAADPESMTPAFADDHAVPVAGGGVRVTLADGVWVVGNLDQGYRAPNLDDLTASSSEGPGYQLPNPSLMPERSVSLEAGAMVRYPRFSGALFAYQTYIDDVITRTPASCPDEVASDCDDELHVFQLTNADAATVHGVELDARVRLPAGVSVFGVATYTRASTIDETGALAPDSKIPPLSGRLGVRFELASSRYFIESIADFAFRQGRLSAVDEGDPRIPAGGTPGYGVAHLRGGARLGDGLFATLTVHNLTDSGYRVHGSGVDGPGFGALFSLSAAARAP